MDNSSHGGGGVPPPGGPRQPVDALLQLRVLDDQLSAERHALERHMELIDQLYGTSRQRDTTTFLLRLVVMLDHAAHLARRCINVTEQRRLLLAAHPSLLQSDPNQKR